MVERSLCLFVSFALKRNEAQNLQRRHFLTNFFSAFLPRELFPSFFLFCATSDLTYKSVSIIIFLKSFCLHRDFVAFKNTWLEKSFQLEHNLIFS
jgi:hypothetical protein